MFKVINNIPSLVIEISSSSIIHRWDTVTKLNSRNLIENKWRRSSVRWIAWVKQICEWVIDGCDIVGEEKRSERYGIGIVESFYEWVFFFSSVCICVHSWREHRIRPQINCHAHTIPFTSPSRLILFVHFYFY